MKKLDPIDYFDFVKFFKIEGNNPNKNYYDFFADSIEKIKTYAIAPYFWYISNNYRLKLEHVSDNITDFTPYSKKEWITESGEFFSELYHPDDRVFILSAIYFITSTYLNMELQQRDSIKINIYVRMLNKNKKYRWMLMQTSKPCISSENRLESALTIFYDLSDLQIKSRPLLSIINYNTNTTQYYTYFDKQIKTIDLQLPKITKREKEILKLIFKGYTTPQIAEKLFISYFTVENHKRNLRQKTNTKTTGELVAFMMTHLSIEFEG